MNEPWDVIHNGSVCAMCPHHALHGMTITCDQPGRLIIAPITSGLCPIGKHVLVDPAGMIEAYEEPEHWGPRVWAEIHTKVDPDQTWLDGIISSLPCGECRDEATAYVRRRPPVFGYGWRRYSWQWHNAVDRKLGKPVMTWRRYCELYPVQSGDALKAI